MATIKVNNKQLYKDICDWKQQIKEKGEHVKMPDSIGQAIMNIAVGFSGYWKFSGYSSSWKSEMVEDAVLANVKGLLNFDETKYDNPHAYITQACYNAFIQRIKSEKKEQAIKHRYFLDHVYDEEDEEMTKIADETFIQDIHEKLNKYDDSIKKESISTKKSYEGPTLEGFYNE